MVGSINAMGKKERLSQLVILEGSPTRTDRRIPKECTQQGDSSPLAQNDSRFDGIYASLCHPRGSNKPSARSRTDRRISQSPLHPRDSSHPLRMTMRRHNDSIITNRHVLFKASIPRCHPSWPIQVPTSRVANFKFVIFEMSWKRIRRTLNEIYGRSNVAKSISRPPAAFRAIWLT